MCAVLLLERKGAGRVPQQSSRCASRTMVGRESGQLLYIFLNDGQTMSEKYLPASWKISSHRYYGRYSDGTVFVKKV